MAGAPPPRNVDSDKLQWLEADLQKLINDIEIYTEWHRRESGRLSYSYFLYAFLPTVVVTILQTILLNDVKCEQFELRHLLLSLCAISGCVISGIAGVWKWDAWAAKHDYAAKGFHKILPQAIAAQSAQMQDEESARQVLRNLNSSLKEIWLEMPDRALIGPDVYMKLRKRKMERKLLLDEERLSAVGKALELKKQKYEAMAKTELDLAETIGETKANAFVQRGSLVNLDKTLEDSLQAGGYAYTGGSWRTLRSDKPISPGQREQTSSAFSFVNEELDSASTAKKKKLKQARSPASERSKPNSSATSPDQIASPSLPLEVLVVDDERPPSAGSPNNNQKLFDEKELLASVEQRSRHSV